MMRILIKFILIAGLAYALQLFFPWQMIMVVPFVLNLAIKTRGAASFFSSFLAIALVWGALALMIHQRTDGILTPKVASLFFLGANSYLLILATACIGGIAGGMAGLTANALRNLIFAPETSRAKGRSRYGRPDYRYR